MYTPLPKLTAALLAGGNKKQILDLGDRHLELDLLGQLKTLCDKSFLI